VKWKTPLEKWENGYTITSAPLYYDGIVYSGLSSGEFGVPGRLTALEAKTGAILWRAYTLPAPGERGSETWPPGTDHSMRGGATIWNTPALDPDLGLVYFATGNCGPDYDGSMREGDNLYCASIMAVKAKTGEYVWHFQQVHHDIWGYEKAGCIFETFWETPVLMQPSGIGGTNWSPVPYSPDTGYFYVPGTVRTSAFTRFGDKYVLGLRYTGGSQAAPIGSPMYGTFTAIDSTTNKIAWQHKTPYRIGSGGGSSVTAGGLVFRGEPDGNFLALDAKTGKELWRFQTGF